MIFTSPKSVSKRLKFYTSLGIFLLVFLACTYSLTNKQQLKFMNGMAEEYFAIAYSYHSTGKMYEQNTVDAKVYRPPGYIFFISSLLQLAQVEPMQDISFSKQEDAEQYLNNTINIVLLAQAVLLGFSAVILFFWLLEFSDYFIATVFAVLFGVNPYSVILTGLLHYSILHIFFILLSGYTLSLSLKPQNIKIVWIFISGCLWALATLVRPLTMILPGFIFILYLVKLRFSFKKAAKLIIIFSLGMMVIIAPYTLRNYMLTKKLILVNAQSGLALWSATEKQSKSSANHYNWWDLWYGEGLNVYEEVVGDRLFQTHGYMNNVLKFEERFKQKAIENLKSQPHIFMRNALQNFISFNTDINSVIIKLFQYIQGEYESGNIKRSLEPGNPQDFYSSKASNLFHWFVMVLQLFGFLALCVAFKKRDQAFFIPVIVYLCFCIAHAITYMDLMYYYTKLPFLFLFSAYFIHQLKDAYVPALFPPNQRKVSVATVINIALCGCTVFLWYLIFA